MAMIGPLKKIVSASCVTEVAGALVELPCPCPGSSFFNKLKHFRGIATRYDKLARNFLAAVQLVDYHPAQLKTGPTQLKTGPTQADWQLKATFKDLARFYRQMAKYLEQTEQSDPKER